MRTVKRLIIPTIYLILSLVAVFVSYQVVMSQEQFAGLSAKEYQVNLNKKQSNSTKAKIGNVGLKDYTKAKNEAGELIETGAIGKIMINKVGISLPIFQYANNTTLSVGVAQYTSNLKMGQGNYILASHNFNGADVLLNRIGLLKLDDEILISNGVDVYKYAVTENKVIKETEVKYLEQTRDATLTLIRCEGGFNTPFRRVVVAKQVKEQALKPSKKQNKVRRRSDKATFNHLAISLFALINSKNGIFLAAAWLLLLVIITVGSFLIF